MNSTNGNSCRICLQDVENPKQYCHCIGSLGDVHEECLTKWLNTKYDVDTDKV